MRATPERDAALSLDAAAHRAQLLEALEAVLVRGGRLDGRRGPRRGPAVRDAAGGLRLEDGERLTALLLVLQQHLLLQEIQCRILIFPAVEM